MSTTVSKYTTPSCGLCYLDSARRAALEQDSPLVRDIILRTAKARLARDPQMTRDGKMTVSAEAHAMHPRRLKPWPSEAAA